MSVVSLAAACIVLAVLFFKRKRGGPESRSLFSFVSLLILMGFCIKLMSVLFGIHFPPARGALFFIPAYLIFLLVLWEHAARIRYAPMKAAAHCLFSVLFIVMIYHNVSSVNLKYMNGWIADADTKDAMAQVYRLSSDDPRCKERKCSMGVHWFFEPGTHYYIVKNQMGWLENTKPYGADGIHDYYYLCSGREDAAVIKKYNLRIVKLYPVSGACLAVPQDVRYEPYHKK